MPSPTLSETAQGMLEQADEHHRHHDQQPPRRYTTYKRRWFGLVQLALLNIVVSWDWLTYAPIANTAAVYFDTTPDRINWLVAGFLFAFVIAAPVSFWALHTSGPQRSIIIASTLLLLGNWIRYGGARASPPSYAAVMVGQIVIGLAQPFVLAAPTRYSELWFSPTARLSATAMTTLANPLGGALGSLVSPMLVSEPADVAPLTLYVAIICSVASLPSFFLPARPPTPISEVSSGAARPPIRHELMLVLRSPNAWLLLVPTWIFIGLFNSLSTLLTQILTPYGWSETDAGIAGGILILVGLVGAAISAPLIDRTKPFLLVLRLVGSVLALSYLAFYWAPPAPTLAAPYVICAVIGATSFMVLPCSLEFLAEFTYPAGPEVSSCLAWIGGQLFGAILVLVCQALAADASGSPPFNFQRAMLFQAVLALLQIPQLFVLGSWRRAEKKRWAVERRLDRAGLDHEGL